MPGEVNDDRNGHQDADPAADPRDRVVNRVADCRAIARGALRKSARVLCLCEVV
jgi:hypothetical protein